MGKKVLLINPPSPDFLTCSDNNLPHSLLYLGSSLQKAGLEVKLLDVNNDFVNLKRINRLNVSEYYSKKFNNELKSFNPDLVGITCLFSGRFRSTIEISKKVKELYSDVPIVIGGIHPTIFPREILEEYMSIDYVCIGEGENTIVDLVNSKELREIKGLAYREKGQVEVNPKESFIEDIDTLPFPAYNLLDLKDYYFDTSKWDNPRNLRLNIAIPLITSRSCPNKCSFCTMNLVHGDKWRARSAKNVVDEIEWLYDKYDHQFFSIMDDNATLSKKRTLEIVDEILKRNLKIQFNTINGLSLKTLDREVVDGLMKAGMIRLYVAPEHGSEYIRNEVMRKNIPTKKIYDFFEMIKDYPLYVRAFFIIGYPQETKETLNETYEMIQKISYSIDDAALFYLVPFPGTEIFEYCKDRKLFSTPIENLHNLETFSNYNRSDIPFVKPHKLELEDLIRFREKTLKLVKERGKVNEEDYKKILI